MVDFSVEINEWGRPRVIFIVPMPHRKPAFMSLDITEHTIKHHGIVIVDSKKFLRLWLSERHSAHQDVLNTPLEKWHNDKKFKIAAEGFSYGRNNPVPLADIGFEREGSINYVKIDDGVTRTMWLLVQGCTSFPVRCISGAEGLFDAAGAEGTSLYTIGEDGLIAIRRSFLDSRCEDGYES